MADSVIDHLFDDAITSDLPMPGTELDFFLDHLPVDDTSTFAVVSSIGGVIFNDFGDWEKYCHILVI